MGVIDVKVNELRMQSGHSLFDQSEKKLEFYDPAAMNEEFSKQFGLNVEEEDDDDIEFMDMKDLKKRFEMMNR